MTEPSYPDARAVESAIKDAAKSTHAAYPTRQTGDLIRQAYYDRFLCRVFSDTETSEWVLKGGTGMLARVPTARRTLDADLYRAGYDKDQALADLRRLAAIDLSDHFLFVYREHHAILAGDVQPYADGYRVTFDAYLGVKLVDTIKIDMSAGAGPTDGVEVGEPASSSAAGELPVPRPPCVEPGGRQSVRNHRQLRRAALQPREGPRRPGGHRHHPDGPRRETQGRDPSRVCPTPTPSARSVRHPGDLGQVLRRTRRQHPRRALLVRISRRARARLPRPDPRKRRARHLGSALESVVLRRQPSGTIPGRDSAGVSWRDGVGADCRLGSAGRGCRNPRYGS